MRQIDPEGAAAATQAADAEAGGRAQAGTELADNPNLQSRRRRATALRDGQVDSAALSCWGSSWPPAR